MIEQKENAPAGTEAQEVTHSRIASLPDELKKLPGWLVWRYEQVAGEKKPRKVPYYVAGGRRKGKQGSAADREKLAVFDAALRAFVNRNFDGVGLAMFADFGMVALDFDNCVDGGAVNPQVMDLVSGTYAEYSPSGNGVRAFMVGDLGNHKSNEAPFGFETFSSSGFVTVTGKSLGMNDLTGEPEAVATVSDTVRQYAQSRFNTVEAAATGAAAHVDVSRVGLSEAQIGECLDALDADTAHDNWLFIGMAIHYETHGEGFDLWDEWSAKGVKYPGTDELNKRWVSFGQNTGSPITGRYLLKEAIKAGAVISPSLDDFDDVSGGVDVEQAAEPPHFAFYAYLPAHQYLHRPTRAFWPAASVDGRLAYKIEQKKVSAWLDRYRAVEQATWHPAHGELLRDVVVADGGFLPRAGTLVYNRYRAPAIAPSSESAKPWLDHLHAIYPAEAEHLIKWFAHRIQKPGEKINHALVLGGNQGIGKDTLLEPVRRGVGVWNWQDIEPKKLTGAFNPFVESVVLRINEARDLGDLDRFAFYDHSKTYIAAPPDVLMCNNKHAKEYPVFNVMGVILTTNHKTNGIYLPLDDRRHYVAWSDARKEEFGEDYWPDLWGWINSGGDGAVIGYLKAVDLSRFNPKAPPPKTDAFYAIVQANANPDDVALVCITTREDGKKLPVVTLDMLAAAAMELGDNELYNALTETKNRRRVPHMMERAGYMPVRNPDATDGLWKIGARRQVVYGDAQLSIADRVRETRLLIPAGK